MNAKITVSKTLDGWTVFKWFGHGTEYVKLSSLRTCGRLTKREAIDMAKREAKREGLPVEIGT